MRSWEQKDNNDDIGLAAVHQAQHIVADTSMPGLCMSSNAPWVASEWSYVRLGDNSSCPSDLLVSLYHHPLLYHKDSAACHTLRVGTLSSCDLISWSALHWVVLLCSGLLVRWVGFFLLKAGTMHLMQRYVGS